MSDRMILKIADGKITVNNMTKGVTYLCSLLWPVIESYWLTLLFIIQHRNEKVLTELKRKAVLQHVR